LMSRMEISAQEERSSKIQLEESTKALEIEISRLTQDLPLLQRKLESETLQLATVSNELTVTKELLTREEANFLRMKEEYENKLDKEAVETEKLWERIAELQDNFSDLHEQSLQLPYKQKFMQYSCMPEEILARPRNDF